MDTSKKLKIIEINLKLENLLKQYTIIKNTGNKSYLKVIDEKIFILESMLDDLYDY